MIVLRNKNNPIIRPEAVKPYLDGCEVIGAFNAALASFKGETVLLLRIAERPVQKSKDQLTVTFYNHEKKRLEMHDICKDDERYDFSDEREVRDNVKRDGSFSFLTSISYLRIARSCDGIHFEIDDKPFIFPSTEYETLGIEDPRITQIGDEYYIYFTSVSNYGICEEMVRTTDFEHIERMGIIFSPENKDVVIFPEKIGGKYYALNRPVPKATGNPEIWISESQNLQYWGNHKRLMGLRPKSWDSTRIGAGAVPIKTPEGWLEIYHGATAENRYCLGAVLLDLSDPTKIISRGKLPIMEPEESYETEGFFGNVVFTCGALCENGMVRLYYGVSDSAVAYAQIKLSDILDML